MFDSYSSISIDSIAKQSWRDCLKVLKFDDWQTNYNIFCYWVNCQFKITWNIFFYSVPMNKIEMPAKD